ncbi:hypothetical protein KKH36_00745 [Patescibacteria group bacterium]|nr:hypothetical protein [Patescibacteria group bacterium]
MKLLNFIGEFIKALFLIVFWVFYLIVVFFPYIDYVLKNTKNEVLDSLACLTKNTILLTLGIMSLLAPFLIIFWGLDTSYVFEISALVYLILGYLFFRDIYPFVDINKVNQKIIELLSLGTGLIKKVFKATLFGFFVA